MDIEKIIDISGIAYWRRRVVAANDPFLPGNMRAVALLDSLALDLPTISSDLRCRLLQIYEANSDLISTSEDVLRDVGFGFFPNSVDEIADTILSLISAMDDFVRHMYQIFPENRLLHLEVKIDYYRECRILFGKSEADELWHRKLGYNCAPPPVLPSDLVQREDGNVA